MFGHDDGDHGTRCKGENTDDVASRFEKGELSMVAAIVKLLGFRLTITTGPGCTAEIAFP